MISIIERWLPKIKTSNISLSRTAKQHNIVKNQKEDAHRKMVGMEPKKRNAP